MDTDKLMFCETCGNSTRVWGYNDCQSCLNEQAACQRIAIAKAEFAEAENRRWWDSTLEEIAELCERAFADGWLNWHQRNILRWAIRKCYEVRS
jgi:hypothetical protein